MTVLNNVIKGAAGAALMYFMDPDKGRRRRAGLRDLTTQTSKDFLRQMDKAARDLSNRSNGAVASAKSLLTKPDPTMLAERVRAKIGRVVSHPHAVHITESNGTVSIEGPVMDYEADNLVKAVKAVPGVKAVQNNLEVYQSPDHISSLQGGVRRESRSEFAKQHWTPALRMGAGGLGGALLAYGLRTGGPRGFATGLAGTALLARALANTEFRQMVGIGADANFQFEKAIHINATPEEVYAFWSDYANFPRFMSHLKEVRELGSGKSHWVAEGPAGASVSWDAEIIEQIPNKKIAWRSSPESQVRTEGEVRFEPAPGGGAKVAIRLRYCPPAGVLGHVVASLFSANPRQEMNDDLVRLKSLLELGRTRAHGKRVTLNDLPTTHSALAQHAT